MLAREEPGRRMRLVIGDEVDLALAPELDIFRAVAGNAAEAHSFKGRFQHTFVGSGEFDEFETVETDRIFEQVGHQIRPPLSHAPLDWVQFTGDKMAYWATTFFTSAAASSSSNSRCWCKASIALR